MRIGARIMEGVWSFINSAIDSRMKLGERELCGGWCNVACCKHVSKVAVLAMTSCIIFIARMVLCPHSTSCWVLLLIGIHLNLPRPGRSDIFYK